MRKRIAIWLCLWLLLALPARAALVLKGGDDAAERLEAARRAAREMPVGHYGMTPIGGAALEDGDYPVEVASSSVYFKVAEATLTVRRGALTLSFVIGSDSYDRVFLGSAADAAGGAPIEGEAVANGARFTVPIPALNAPFALAAHSKKRDRWYDRWLLADAASLPEGALGFALPDYATLERALLGGAAATPAPGEAAEAEAPAEPAAVGVPDGEYAIEVSLSGGSGRASVSSPTLLVVREGRAWARLLWSSAYYDYMRVGGTRYDNLSTDGGNSSFEIPVSAMDAPIRVIADTTAMGDQVEIEYRLTF